MFIFIHILAMAAIFKSPFDSWGMKGTSSLGRCWKMTETNTLMWLEQEMMIETLKPVFNRENQGFRRHLIIWFQSIVFTLPKLFSDCRCSCVVHVLLCWYFTYVSTTSFERSDFFSAKTRASSLKDQPVTRSTANCQGTRKGHPIS